MDQTTIKKEDVSANGTATTALPVAADANKRPAPVGNGSMAPVSKKPNTAAVGTTAKSQLQQQIQQQLQQQLQAQLQAAAARGQQANITPEQIQVRDLDAQDTISIVRV